MMSCKFPTPPKLKHLVPRVWRRSIPALQCRFFVLVPESRHTKSNASIYYLLLKLKIINHVIHIIIIDQRLNKADPAYYMYGATQRVCIAM